MFTQWWWSSGAEANDSGVTIANSLRFRGGQRLVRDGMSRPAGDFTYSVWVKCAWTTSTDNNSIFGNSTSVNGFKIGNAGGSQAFELSCRNGTSLISFSPGSKLRDPNAWYHFVFQTTGGNTTAFVNGVQHGNPISQFQVTGNAVIGSGNAANMDEAFHGYMASVYCIDGQILEPTAFGRYNSQGVWVPREIDFDGVYGANGFHLDFADPDDLGADRSGNGNDFQAFGFNTTPAGRFSDKIGAGNSSTDTTSSCGTASVGDMFDLTTSGSPSSVNPETCWLVFAPSPALTGVTKVEVFLTGLFGQQVAINGTVGFGPNNGTSGWVDVSLPTGFTGELTTLGIVATNGSNRCHGVRINGNRILVDSTGVQYDQMVDSPTRNYATGSSLNMPTGTREYIPSFANLGNNQSSGGVQGGLQPTFPWDATRQWYFEVKVSNYPVNSWFGFNGNPGPNAQTGTTGAGISNGVINWSMNGGGPLGTMAAVNGPFDGITWTPNYTVQENVIAGWEWDGPNRRIRYYENGVLRSTSSQWAADSFETANFFFGYNASPTTNWTYNFGQQPFVDRPAGLTDANNLQTQNLPAVTIRDGREHFRAITDTGADILTAAQDAFPNGLWWIKDRITSSTQHQLVDSVRGGDTALQCPGLTQAAYDPPDGNSVAWCWNYNAADPSINGFDIVTYTGNATPGRTVPHSLGSAPEFIITKERGSSDSRYFCCYHVGGGVGYSYLNDPLAYQHDPTTPVMYQAVSATDWTYDGNDQVNGSGVNFVSYAWTSVPGYSAFGSYQGNSLEDNVFVHLGFRPAFLMIKRLDTADQWMVVDSTRSPSNPCAQNLTPNSTAAENGVAGITDAAWVDLLSNGFKIRLGNGTFGGAGSTYAYCAFAEMPQGGSNTSPANAR